MYKPDLRSIRLDIFAADKERNSYNLEMENWDKGQSLVKRSRFYQAEMGKCRRIKARQEIQRAKTQLCDFYLYI